MLELLDMFIEPPVAAAPGFLAVRMLGAFELEIDGRPVTHWRGQRTQSLMQFLAAAAYRSCAQALNCEFGVTPAAQTSRVYHQIRATSRPGSRRLADQSVCGGTTVRVYASQLP